MSMELMVQAMKIKVGNPLRKLVLIKLADNANDQGECWPSYQHIADQCEIGKSTVRKHIKDLESAGFLSIENRKGPQGNSSNIYHLHFNRGTFGEGGVSDGGIPPVPPDSTGVSDGATPPVSPDSTGISPDSRGVPPDSTPPVPPDSTRTSHSFEPVKEPVNESIGDLSAPKSHKKKTPRKSGLDFSKWPAEPDKQIFADWKTMRTAKKAPVTQTVINRMAAELKKAGQGGYTVDQCLELCCERGWQGFQFQWLLNSQSSLPVPDRLRGDRAAPAANHQRLVSGALDHVDYGETDTSNLDWMQS